MSELASPGQLRMSYVRVALVLVPLVLLLGVASGSLSGSGDANGWYRSIVRPAETPPGWVFPIAWTILYVLLGLALSMIVSARGASGRGLAVGLFAAQLVLNLLWSPVFFGMHRVRLAFAIILGMIVLTVATILAFARIRRRAAWLMAPYLAWICFASWLNHRIDVLNPPLAEQSGGTQISL